MMANDIKYLREKVDEILEQVKETNGTVRQHDRKIITLERDQSNHFRNHDLTVKSMRHIDKLSRTQLLIIAAFLNIGTIIAIAIIMR